MSKAAKIFYNACLDDARPSTTAEKARIVRFTPLRRGGMRKAYSSPEELRGWHEYATTG
jgi:hypothetical protein